jgi:pilus assembly protein FimV
MHSNQRPPILSFALKTLTAAVASAVFLSGAANAAGLGKLTVLSALGQPLRAEIELTAVSGDEASGLVAKLASPDAFKVANIDFNPALLSLRFAVEQRGTRQIIRITSSQPLNEPFVDMLLELSWNNGRLVREYTFLLDPAELRATQTAQAAAPGEAPASQRARDDKQPVRAASKPPAEASQPAQRPARAADQAATPESGSRAPVAASKYRVRPGDTLGRIATELKPVDISLDMMLVALYRANPDAFIGNNMNRLKSGQILSVPDSDAMRGTGAAEAHGVVVAHAADFNAYRNKLAGQVATSAPVRAPAAGQSAAGKVTAKVEERPTAANESQDQLRLSKALPSQSAGAKGVTTSTEDTIAREKALSDAQARVKELEKNVNDLEKLVTVKNKAGTELAQNARQEAAPATKNAPAAKSKVVPIAPKKAAQPEPGLAETLMDNLNYVGAGAAVLLLAAFGLSRRRKQSSDGRKGADEPSLLHTPAEQGQSLFAETGGQNIDTNNSVFNSSFSPSASQLDTNEVDPVAEADVYIAYGRDAQAEEILKEALRVHPERYQVRLKLLEIYAARKDQRAFEAQASELYSVTRGEGDEWAQAAALGLSIDPLNPLYASAANSHVAAHPTTEELGQQALLAQQLEQSFRTGDPHTGIDAVTGLGLADSAPTALPGHQATSTGADDDHVLDFDLGGLSFEPVEATAATREEQTDATAVPDLDFDMEPFAPAAAPAAQAAAAPAGEAAQDDAFDLAFDMDFDKAGAGDAQPEPSLDKADDGLALDLSLGGPATDVDMAGLAKEFDLPELPSAPEDAAPATELKDPLFDLDAMNFELPATPAEAPAPAAGQETAAPETAATELKDPLFDLDAMNFDLPETQDAPNAGASGEPPALEAEDFAMPETPAAPMPNPIPRFDMSAIDLDLPPAEGGDEPMPLQQMEMVGAGEMSAAHMEMETKLDLAIAYQEIGDKEGARELLDEVIKGGNSEQVSKANAMRSKLA